jgi:hypothetical protein
MATFITSKNISHLSFSETVIGGTVCGKTARTGLWGSGVVTIRSTRTLEMHIPPKGLTKSFRINDLSGLSGASQG